jgi:peptidoglycan/LPS O-acetylase OafA/YrhL
MAGEAARFSVLDSWRGIAAIVVALFHFQAAGYFYDIPIVRNGVLAVPFFFVLSGFVITHAYGAKLNEPQDIYPFLIRRFGRIYPLHIATLGILVALECVKVFMASHGYKSAEAPFSGTNDVSSLIANIFMLHAIIPYQNLSWNAASWSISTEFYTYVLFASIFILLRAQRLAGVIGVFIVSGLILLYLDVTASTLNLSQGVGLAQCIFGFSAGTLTYWIYRRLHKTTRWMGTASEVLATVLMLALFWFKPPYTSSAILLFSVIVFLFAFENGVISAFLRRRVFAFLGEISYSIYLVHFIVFSVAFALMRVFQSALHTPLIHSKGGHDLIDFGFAGLMDVLALLYLLTVILFASITYYLVEVPGRSYFNRLSERFRPGRRVAAQSVNPGA